jgi:hypothetical protein
MGDFRAVPHTPPSVRHRREFRTSNRNCPKSLGRVCSVALRAAEKLLLAHFVVRIAAKSTLGALLKPLFGQFHKVHSAKFAVASSQPISTPAGPKHRHDRPNSLESAAYRNKHYS